MKIASNSVVLEDATGRRLAALRPHARLDGGWFAPDAADCELRDGVLVCQLPGHGVLLVHIEEGVATLEFEACRELVLESLELRGVLELEGPCGWLSNGFHSWSQSGMLALREPPSEEELAEALAQRGDVEVVREGPELSWWFSYVANESASLVVFALTADRLRTWIQFSRSGSANVDVRIVCGAGERVRLRAGERLRGEQWGIALGGAEPKPLLAQFANLLPSRRHTHPRAPQRGWNSWYELWDTVSHEAVRDNAHLAADLFAVKPGQEPLRIVVDDGWQKNWGDWEPNHKFPRGLDGLAQELGSHGFSMGVWLAPLLAHPESEVAVRCPHWFLPDVDYWHIKHGAMRILDVTHPEAADHLQGVIARLVGWGYDFLKIDFLFAGTFEAKRYDENVTAFASYHRALQLIRAAAGESTFLSAIAAPPIGTLAYVDSYRFGFDIAVEHFGDDRMEPSWPFLANQARSFAARWFLAEATLCDADPFLLRGLSHEEVAAGAWLARMAGGALFLSDDLRLLSPERKAWAKELLAEYPSPTAAASPRSTRLPSYPAVLSNPYGDHAEGRCSHCVPLAWELPDGQTLLWNASDKPLRHGSSEVPAHAVRVLPGDASSH